METPEEYGIETQVIQEPLDSTGSEATVVQEQEETQAQPQPTPQKRNIDDFARSKGWRPKEEYSGDPERWVDAETFVDRQWDISNHQRNVIDELRGQVSTLVQRTQEEDRRLAEQEINQKVTLLEEKLYAAVEDGDVGTVKQLNQDLLQAKFKQQQIEQQKNQPPQQQPKPLQPDEVSMVNAFKERNPWLGKDKELTEMAQAIENHHAQMKISVADSLRVIEETANQILQARGTANPANYQPSTANTPAAPSQRPRLFAPQAAAGRPTAAVEQRKSPFAQPLTADDMINLQIAATNAGISTSEYIKKYMQTR
jgi:hypothetical protein